MSSIIAPDYIVKAKMQKLLDDAEQSERTALEKFNYLLQSNDVDFAPIIDVRYGMGTPSAINSAVGFQSKKRMEVAQMFQQYPDLAKEILEERMVKNETARTGTDN